jgi:predicted RNA-binding protein associated with RNAse of E/G family
MKSVAIHYRRPPDRLEVFDQRVLLETEEYVVTIMDAAKLEKPVQVEQRVVLEAGSRVIWFTYPGQWYDIGRFHLADGTFTGIYANILTPVRMEGAHWETTDLFLDVWAGADGVVRVLDQAEFEQAVEAGLIDPATAATARGHAETLALAARQGVWPPEHVSEWDLERVRQRLTVGGP